MRALPLFDEIIIAIGVNINKQALTSMELRQKLIESAFRNEPKVKVVTYTGLTADVARLYGANFFLRGVRMIQDFENEMNMAEVNRELSGIETVLLYTLPEYSHISSSIVRELVKYEQDVSSYLPINIDYTTGEVAVPTGILLDDDTTEGKSTGSGSNWRRTDTVNYSIFVDAAWLNGESEEFADVMGTMYDDGSIEFNDDQAYVFAGYQALVTYKRSGSSWSGYTYSVVSSDTTYFEEYYVGTQFIVPNATHDYDLAASTTTHYTEDVYMFQHPEDQNTAVVFNLYGMGMPGFTMNIYEDGSMVMPLDWPVSEMGKLTRDYYADYYGSAYNWDNTRWYWLVNVDEEGEATEDTVILGTVEPTAIKWDRAAYILPGIVRVSDGAEMQLGSYPFVNNVLTFTDDSEFVFAGPDALRGDANSDTKVDIDDVTFLIDALLTNNFDDLGDGADCDLNGEITIDDVVCLIDFLLTNNWPE